MKYNFLLLLSAVLLCIGCEDKTGTLELKFLGSYDGAPLILGEMVEYDDYQLQFFESDFYISEISLTDGSSITEVKDIDFVDFTNTNFSLEGAENGFSLVYNNIETGNYDGLRFGIGVPPVENMTKPSDYNSDHVLSKPGYYWQAWDSYIFAKLAGKYKDEAGTFDDGFLFHTGTDDLFRTREGNFNISINEESTTIIEIIIDHEKLLKLQNGDFYDIQNNSTNHDPTDPVPLQMLVNNYSDAISFQQ